MAYFVKTQFPLNASEWTPITATINCDHFWMKNIGAGNVTYLRTNQSDATTQDQLQTGFQESCIVYYTAKGPTDTSYRFMQGSVILYAQPDQGVGPLVVTFAC
jgi:hypothetical protein